MTEYKISYAPPTGKPLGVNPMFRIGATVVIPLLRAITKRTWIGAENLPKSGPTIVISNHLSYIDVLLLTFFLYKNGRAPRYLGKEGVFKVPVLGKILLAAGQVPVQRESATASDALKHAIALINAGHLIGVYPEGTLTRDADHWPMIAKTGLARLAITTKAPVIPIVQWGTQIAMPTYGKKIRLFPRTKITLICGKPLDFSPWFGKESDPQALIEATAYAMRELTTTLEGIRGEKRPAVIFDPHTSALPRTGNFKKGTKK
jgi:1-acyl-sn-glycerol-3-phosphate acyltransferase